MAHVADVEQRVEDLHGQLRVLVLTSQTQPHPAVIQHIALRTRRMQLTVVHIAQTLTQRERGREGEEEGEGEGEGERTGKREEAEEQLAEVQPVELASGAGGWLVVSPWPLP